jgi:hypothetical protein
MMTDQADDVFRFPTDAADERVDRHTLEEWARGDTHVAREAINSHDPDETPYIPSGYGGFEPGAVVEFMAVHHLGSVETERRGDELVALSDVPALTTRLIERNDPDNQGDRLSDFCLDGIDQGIGLDLDCCQDTYEYWRCAGAKAHGGQPDTRTFEPASFLDYIRYLASNGDYSSVSGHDLKHLLRRVIDELCPRATQPQLPLAKAEGSA